MCTRCRYIYNPYIRRSVLVKCGKCPACQQEKANARAQRIKNNVLSGTINLFVTLTYSNDYVPYVLRSDLESDEMDINVYRNYECRFTYSKYKGYAFKKYYCTDPVMRCYIPFEVRHSSEIVPLKGLNGLGKDKIGVCLLHDFQLFIKRLRQILKRHYNYDKKLSYFLATEYGGHSYRPHGHLLFNVGSSDEEIFRAAILKAWPYADSRRTERYIEVSRDASSYVASYVNSNFRLSSPLSADVFKQKHSYSQNFGLALDCFNLVSLLPKIESGDLFYYRSQKFDGVSSVVNVPVPEYVLGRYFPKFKGYSLLSSSTLERLLLKPDAASEILSDDSKVYRFRECLDYCCYHFPENDTNNLRYEFSDKECYRIYVRLENAYQYFHKKTGLNRFDYVHYYLRAWKVHSLSILKDSYKDISVLSDFDNFYENANDLVNGIVRSDLSPDNMVRNPNQRLFVRQSTNYLTLMYDRMNKQRKVTNLVMTHNGHLV